MRPVGVHQDQELVAAPQPESKAGHAGAPQAELGRPVDDVNPRVGLGEEVRDRPRAVRRVVVDHEGVVSRPPDARDHSGQVGSLVEGRENDQAATLAVRQDAANVNKGGFRANQSHPACPVRVEGIMETC